MGTVLWLLGFGLMMASFSFLFGGKSTSGNTPRITVEPLWPEPERDRHQPTMHR